ncbi:MAG: hypothetical protein Q7S40_15080 [Opitutaceae bacterium]|nr:hypothetical protein [Opitutaceae bacterium]
MTTRDLVLLAGQHPVAVLLSVFVAPPVLAWLAGHSHGKEQGRLAPWKYLYAVLVYLVCVPGMFAGVITAYTLFISGENLLDANLLVYFLPIASMVATLVLIRKNVPFDDVPGFDRLSGLMVMVGCSFVIALVIQKTRIFVFFGGSIEKLFLLAAGVFGLLKWGTWMLFRRRDEPKREPPEFPGA